MRNTLTAVPSSLAGAALVLTFAGTGCHPEHIDATNAPDDANLNISFDCQYKRVAVNQTCMVHGLVLLSTGEAAGAEWTVDLRVSTGALTPAGTTGRQLLVRLQTGPSGEIIVPFIAPADTGNAVFTLTSHGATKVDTLRVFQPDADVIDDPAVASIVLAPANVSVKRGDSTLVTAAFLDGNKQPLTGRKAYFFTDDAATASVGSAPADRIWVKGIAVGTTVLRVSRKAILVSAPVTVTP